MKKVFSSFKNWTVNLSLKDKILAILCLIVLFACAVLTMTYGRTVVNSDMAIASLFADSFYKHHNFFSGTWSYANGDIWTLYPTVGILSILVHPFLGAGDVARTIVVVIQMILGAVALGTLSKKYFKDESWMLMVPLGTMYLFGIAVYVLYDGCYGDFIIWQPLVCMLFINAYRKYAEGKLFSVKLAVYMVILYILSVRGPRTLADFALPMIMTVVVMVYIRAAERKSVIWKTDLKDAIYWIFANAIPAVLGLITYNWLATWHNINNVKESLMVFSGSMSDVWNGLIKTVLYYFEVFGFQPDVSVSSMIGLRNFVSIVMCAIICIVVPILQGRKILKETKTIQFIYFYAMLHNLVMLLCGVFFDFVIKYHMTSSVVLFVIVSARYIYVYWIKQENEVRGYAWTALFVVASLIECVAMLSNVGGWKNRLEAQEKVSDVLEDHGLTKGYATFWNAYANQLYSDDKVRIGGITVEQNRLQEYWWLVDNSIYEPEETQSFIMLTDEELAGEYNYETILYGYEQPIDEFIIEDALCYNDVRGEYRTNLNVYVYADDYAKYLVNGSNDGVVEPKEMFFNGMGTIDDSQVALTNGGLIFGPYSSLDKGEYIVSYNGGGLSNCEVEILSENNPGDYSYEVVSTSDTVITAKLTVTSRVEGIQYRISNNTDELAIVLNITVDRE